MEPDQKFSVTAKDILLRLLMTIIDNQVCVMKNHDVECLHQFRVALRRSRVLLNQLNGIFPLPTIRRFKREFDWLGNITGPTRDLDVFLLVFEKIKLNLSDENKRDLLPFFNYLKWHQNKEHIHVKKYLILNAI